MPTSLLQLPLSAGLFMFLLLTACSTAKPQQESSNNASYHPVKMGAKHTYTDGSIVYNSTFDNKYTERNGKKYLALVSDYGNKSQILAYYREENGDVIYIKPDQKKETIEIPSQPKNGFTWFESDSTWRYTIRSLNSLLETPNGNYKDCLVIESTPIKLNKTIAKPLHFMQYYQRGNGYVGTIMNGVLNAYLVPASGQ